MRSRVRRVDVLEAWAFRAINTEPGSRPASCCVAFRGISARNTMRYFGTCPTPQPKKCHRFNTVISAPELLFIRMHASGAGFLVIRPGFLDSENTRHKTTPSPYRETDNANLPLHRRRP